MKRDIGDERPPADPRLALVERLFSGTGASYDWMVNAATFGIDRRWKRDLLARIPPHASAILDLACGTGILTLAIARRFPGARVVGVELREEYLAIARAKVARLGLANVEWVHRRAEDYVVATRFDCIVSSYLAKYAQLDRLVANNRRMLAPGGLLVMHDFTYPPRRHLVWLFHLYFVLLRALGGALFPAWRTIYRDLPRLIEGTRWCEELEAALRAEGFEAIRRDDLTLYGSAVISARAPG